MAATETVYHPLMQVCNHPTSVNKEAAVVATHAPRVIAPLASVESLRDIVVDVPLSNASRVARTPPPAADSGRGSPSTVMEMTTPSISNGTASSSGVDTTSWCGGSSHAPGAMDVDAIDTLTLPTWMPGRGDSLGESDVDGWTIPKVTEPINLAFKKLSYSVMCMQRLKWEKRRILHGVSGEFKAGQLTAIMGPSGAGKSTLLDVLSGYTSSGVQGHLQINGSPRDSRIFRRQSVYIQQDAPLHPQLSVTEAMNVAAVLKLGGRGPEVQETIEEVLQSLGLLEHRHTMTSRLSGGQLKRLATALELLSNPPVMFFDEPTSGLDSSTTKQCVGVLRRLARQGRTVVCTIHQPSATVFEMLDQLYLVVNGRCAYRGHTANLLPYLAGLGLRCPPYHNPADYALEVAGGEYGDHLDALVKASDNGRCVMWTTTSTVRLQAAGPSSGVPGSVSTSAPSLSRQSSSEESATPPEKGICRHSIGYPTTFWMQLYVLIKRTFLKGLRDRMLCHSRLYIHLAAGLLIGVLFMDIGNDAAHVFHNLSLLFFCLMFLMFTALSAMILAFPLEMPIIAREHFNRWYSLKSYFLAVTMADVPLQGVCVLVYTVVVYYMTAQPMEIVRFLMLLIILALVSFVAQSVGLLVGAAMKIEHGVIFGPLAILPFTIFSGFFVHQRDAPLSMQWLFKASFLKYGLSGCMLAVYGAGRPPMGCSDDYCHFTKPDKFLHELDLDRGNYWVDAGVLFAIGSVLRLCAYFVLKFRLRRFRQ